MSDLEQRLTTGGVTRRRFLQGSALAGFGAFLAACTGGGSTLAPGTPSASASTAPTSASAAPSATSAEPPKVTGPLNFANWDAYIDVNDDGVTSPTIEDFKKEYSVDVNYANAKIEDNATFVATIRPQLESGVDTGWDLIVITDWMAAKLVEAKWLEHVDPSHVPDAVANVRDELKGLPWDPNMDFHYPWQSGATGLGYNGKSTKRDLTKMADLFDPAFKGKVTLLSEVRDSFPLILLMLKAQGKAQHDPEEMTPDDAQIVHDYLKPFVEDGQIRAFTGNEYLSDFASGDTWVAQVWSGDLASSATEDDHFVYPEEGSMIWTDNMLIPKGAKNKYTAELMINWVYNVDRAARLANYIYYISPVKGVADAIKKLDATAGDNPLLFPPPDVVAKQHQVATWNEADETKINDLYSDLAGA